MNAKVEWPDRLWFHQNPQKREWDKSYTREVCIRLGNLQLSYPGTWIATGVQEAKSLLEQYWHDLHLPYEQRDEARREVQNLKRRVIELKQANNNLRNQLIDYQLDGLRVGVNVAEVKKKIDDIVFTKATESKPVEFFACQHYPCATTNYFQHIAVCEHGCESVPLKWCDNGHHRKPQ